MKITTEVTATNGGGVKWQETNINYVPQVVASNREATASVLFDHVCLTSDRCIYCGSQDQLTKEHMVPYALGGKAIIRNGSCETCRNKTHKFETNVLRGPMRYVRFLQGLPSRSDHRELRRSIPLWVRQNDVDVKLEVDVSEAPILLPYPIFAQLSSSSHACVDLSLVGHATGSYGVDPGKFVAAHGIQELRLLSSLQSPVAFAQSMAKIAYCFAWSQRALPSLDDASDLVHAMLNAPETLGQFVGTASEPFIAFPDLTHRIEMKDDETLGIRVVEVQLFASSGAPTYLVKVGRLRYPL